MSQVLFAVFRRKAIDVEVTLCSEEDRQAFRNLFAFYRYDLMPFIEGGPGSGVNQYGVIDGETSKTHEEAFGDDDLFQKPGVISPFLIRADGELAGLAVVATQPHATPGRDYRMGEFFVLNKFRRRSVGRMAALALLNQFRGRWEIAQRPTNHGAIAFWQSIVHEHTGGNYITVQIVDNPGEAGGPGQNFDNTIKS